MFDDVSVYRDEFGKGALCDCGDDALWKPSGNCSDHTGMFSSDQGL